MWLGSNMTRGSTWNYECFEIWAGAQLEPVIGGLATRFKFFKISVGSLKIHLQSHKMFSSCLPASSLNTVRKIF